MSLTQLQFPLAPAKQWTYKLETREGRDGPGEGVLWELDRESAHTALRRSAVRIRVSP